MLTIAAAFYLFEKIRDKPNNCYPQFRLVSLHTFQSFQIIVIKTYISFAHFSYEVIS